MITYFAKSKGSASFEVINKPTPGAWTHVVAPTSEELASVIKEFNLDETIVADIKDVFEVPRFEQEGSVTYFFTRYLNEDKTNDTDTSPILIILGSGFIVTISDREAPFLTPFTSRTYTTKTTGGTHFFLEVMSALITNYEWHLNTMRKSVQRDISHVRNIRARDIQRLVLSEQELNEVMSALLPTHAWLHQLTQGNYIQMFSEDKDMLEDLLIASGQLVDSAKTILKTIQNIRSASEAFLTQKLNATIRMLTAFTIILTIPTLIASLFGMNVHVPFENSPHGFLIVFALIVVVVIVTLHFFTKKHWI